MTATYKVILHRIEINIVIIAVTFGFDEKFAIRALMRHPPSDRKRVVVLLPEEGLGAERLRETVRQRGGSGAG
jgi:hypothetical protein